LIHAVEMAFESINVSGPEPTERSQPGIDLLKWFRPQPIETALRVHCGLHETGLSQHSQVLGNRGLRKVQLVFDITYGSLGRRKQTQDGAAARLGNDGKCGFHALLYLLEYIAVKAHANTRSVLSRREWCLGRSALDASPAVPAPVSVNATEKATPERRRVGHVNAMDAVARVPTKA